MGIRLSRRHKHIIPVCDYTIRVDVKEDCRIDLEDLAELASDRMVDCWVTPPDPVCIPK